MICFQCIPYTHKIPYFFIHFILSCMFLGHFVQRWTPGQRTLGHHKGQRAASWEYFKIRYWYFFYYWCFLGILSTTWTHRGPMLDTRRKNMKEQRPRPPCCELRVFHFWIFLVRTWFHCGHRGDRSCTELQLVSDVLCSLFCGGVGILGGAGDTSSFARHSLHLHSWLHPVARWRKRRSWRSKDVPRDLLQVAESQLSRFCTSHILGFRRDDKILEAKSAIATPFQWWNCKHFPQDPNITPSMICVPQVPCPGDRRRPPQIPEGNEANARQMPVETWTFFWNLEALWRFLINSDHWCLHWFTLDSRRCRSRCCRCRMRCCSGTRCDTFFCRRVESLNSGSWFCCHPPASGHNVPAIQGRPVSASVTVFLSVVTCPERKCISGWSRSLWPMEFLFHRSCWKISMEFHGVGVPSSRKDREREPATSEFARSWALLSGKIRHVNAHEPSCCRRRGMLFSPLTRCSKQSGKNSFRTGGDESLEQLVSLIAGISGTHLPQMMEVSPVSNSKWRQHNNMKKAQTFLQQLTCWLWKYRSCESVWTRRMKKCPRRACLAQGIDVVSMDMMWTWCYWYFASHYTTQLVTHSLEVLMTLMTLMTFSYFFHPRRESHFCRWAKRWKVWNRLNLGVDWNREAQGSSAQHVLAPGSCNRPLQKLRLFTPENSAICLSTIQM